MKPSDTSKHIITLQQATKRFLEWCNKAGHDVRSTLAIMSGTQQVQQGSSVSVNAPIDERAAGSDSSDEEAVNDFVVAVNAGRKLNGITGDKLYNVQHQPTDAQENAVLLKAEAAIERPRTLREILVSPITQDEKDIQTAWQKCLSSTQQLSIDQGQTIDKALPAIKQAVNESMRQSLEMIKLQEKQKGKDKRQAKEKEQDKAEKSNSIVDSTSPAGKEFGVIKAIHENPGWQESQEQKPVLAQARELLQSAMDPKQISKSNLGASERPSLQHGRTASF